MKTERIVTIPVNLAITIPDHFDDEDAVAYVADAINETLRPVQRSWNLDSCILDYEICVDKIKPNAADPDNYDEGDAF